MNDSANNIPDSILKDIVSAGMNAIEGVPYHENYIGNLDPMSPKYDGDVVRMKFKLMIGKMDTHNEMELLCDHNSYLQGISISELKWGFYSPSSYGDASSANISFTLHDISGKLINSVMKLRAATHYIYFHGPMSNGELWFSSKNAIYTPEIDSCKIEFSPTQGFTYTFGGKPIIQQASSPVLKASQSFSITGDKIPEGTSFKKYVEEEFTTTWNSHIVEDQKKPTAQIKLTVHEHGSSGSKHTANKPQVKVKAKDGKVSQIESFNVKTGDLLSNSIRNMFYTRFYDEEESVVKKGTNKDDSSKTDTKKSTKPQITIIYDRWAKNTVNEIHVFIFDDHDRKQADNLQKICIGSDLTCIGSQFRGQLVGMNFDSFYSFMAASSIEQNIDGSNSNHDVAQGGNNDTTIEKSDEYNVGRKTQIEEVTIANSADFTKIGTGNWGLLESAMNSVKSPSFTIDVEMPYSFGFTPKSHGGYLLDQIESTVSSGISAYQGVDLDFYWYTEPTCSFLARQDGVSGKYRLVEVTHSLGLNGNTTQLKLSHLTL